MLDQNVVQGIAIQMTYVARRVCFEPALWEQRADGKAEQGPALK